MCVIKNPLLLLCVL